MIDYNERRSQWNSGQSSREDDNNAYGNEGEYNNDWR